MAKQDLGKKRRCASCGMKFYDFNKSKIECPGCKTEFNPDNLLKSRKGRGAKQAEEKTAAAAIDEKELLSDDEDDADVDTDDLGDDETFADIPTADNDDEEDAAILDDNVDEDFIDDIEEENSGEE